MHPRGGLLIRVSRRNQLCSAVPINSIRRCGHPSRSGSPVIPFSNAPLVFANTLRLRLRRRPPILGDWRGAHAVVHTTPRARNRYTSTPHSPMRTATRKNTAAREVVYLFISERPPLAADVRTAFSERILSRNVGLLVPALPACRQRTRRLALVRAALLLVADSACDRRAVRRGDKRPALIKHSTRRAALKNTTPLPARSPPRARFLITVISIICDATQRNEIRRLLLEANAVAVAIVLSRRTRAQCARATRAKVNLRVRVATRILLPASGTRTNPSLSYSTALHSSLPVRTHTILRSTGDAHCSRCSSAPRLVSSKTKTSSDVFALPHSVQLQCVQRSHQFCSE